MPPQSPPDTALTLRTQSADWGSGAGAGAGEGGSLGLHSALSRGRGSKRGSVSWADEPSAHLPPREAGQDKSTQTGAFESDPSLGHQQATGPLGEPSAGLIPEQVTETPSEPQTHGAPKAKCRAQARKSSLDESPGRGGDKARRDSEGEHP